eukprot:222953_1
MIPIIVIKHVITVIADLLVIIFNYWMRTSDTTYGYNWREIRPLRKFLKKVFDVIKSFRPVSLQEVLWKLYESIINNRVTVYLISMTIIVNIQCGGRKAIGSEDAVQYITHTIQTISRFTPIKSCAIDESDAYDSMNDGIVEDRYRFHCGINDDGIIMIRSVYKDRKSYTTVNGSRSDICDTLSGPYQGAPMSQTTWIVYLNPILIWLLRQQRQSSCGMYIFRIATVALIDDITILHWIQRNYPHNVQRVLCMYYGEWMSTDQPTYDIQRQAIAHLQYCMDTLFAFLKMNNIPANDDKTQLITIHERSYDKYIDAPSDDQTNLPNHRFQMRLNDDYLYYYRWSPLHNIQRSRSVIILGIEFGEFIHVTFDGQVTRLCQKMTNIRKSVMGLIQTKRTVFKIGEIKQVIQLCSTSLLNYCGNTIYPCIDTKQRNRINTAMDMSLKILNPGLPTIATEVRRNFHQFTSAKAQYRVMMAKIFCRFLRINTTHPFYHLKREYISKFSTVASKVTALGYEWWTMTIPQINAQLDPHESQDIIIQWFLYAFHVFHSESKMVDDDHCHYFPSDVMYFDQEYGPSAPEYETQDTHDHGPLLRQTSADTDNNDVSMQEEKEQMVNTTRNNHNAVGTRVNRNTRPTYTIPHTDPMVLIRPGRYFPANITNYKWIRFNPRDTTWKDEDINPQHYTAFTDGAMDFSTFHSKKLGSGGGALVVYRHGNIQHIEVHPISTRTHNNICEFEIIQYTLEYYIRILRTMTHDTAANFEIITDSQVSLRILDRTDTPNDDVMISIAERTDLLLATIHQLIGQLPITITFSWVHSHDESKYNNEVDEYAKLFKVIMAWTGINRMHPMRPNSRIAYGTIKSEIKSERQRFLRDQWLHYRSNVGSNYGCIDYRRG